MPKPGVRGGLPPFSAIPHAIQDDMRVTGDGLLVYGALRRFTDFGKSTGARPKTETIAERARVSVRQVFNALRLLKKLGWIEWSRTGRANRYVVRMKPKTRYEGGAYRIRTPDISDVHDMHIHLDRDTSNKETLTERARSVANKTLGRDHLPRYPHTKIPPSPKRNTFRYAEQWYRDMVQKHLDKDAVISSAWLQRKKKVLTKFWPKERWDEFYRVMEVMIRTWPEWCQKNKQDEAYPPLHFVGTGWWPKWEGWADKHSAGTMHSGNPHSFS